MNSIQRYDANFTKSICNGIYWYWKISRYLIEVVTMDLRFLDIIFCHIDHLIYSVILDWRVVNLFVSRYSNIHNSFLMWKNEISVLLCRYFTSSDISYWIIIFLFRNYWFLFQSRTDFEKSFPSVRSTVIVIFVISRTTSIKNIKNRNYKIHLITILQFCLTRMLKHISIYICARMEYCRFTYFSFKTKNIKKSMIRRDCYTFKLITWEKKNLS